MESKINNPEETKGTIFNIQRFSLHDGPGIRTLIFTKGCPLRCRWCSNPEGISDKIEISCDNRKCIGCGVCAFKCPKKAVNAELPTFYEIDRKICDCCGQCVRFCPTGAKDFCGEVKTVSEIVETVKRDMPFYTKSEGGVTIGGGELLSQPKFSYEILKNCKDLGINTAIETSGFGKKDALLKIAGAADTIYYDIKAFDGQLHKKITGAGNGIILNNLIALNEKLLVTDTKTKLIIRIPLIDGFNATETNIEQIANFIKNNLSANCFSLVEFLLFHNLGEHKYEQLGFRYELKGRKNAKSEDYNHFADIMNQKGIPCKISQL